MQHQNEAMMRNSIDCLELLVLFSRDHKAMTASDLVYRILYYDSQSVNLCRQAHFEGAAPAGSKVHCRTLYCS